MSASSDDMICGRPSRCRRSRALRVNETIANADITPDMRHFRDYLDVRQMTLTDDDSLNWKLADQLCLSCMGKVRTNQF